MSEGKQPDVTTIDGVRDERYSATKSAQYNPHSVATYSITNGSDTPPLLGVLNLKPSNDSAYNRKFLISKSGTSGAYT